jgi:hypothetical protein
MKKKIKNPSVRLGELTGFLFVILTIWRICAIFISSVCLVIAPDMPRTFKI